jgi:hypothetical protein
MSPSSRFSLAVLSVGFLSSGCITARSTAASRIQEGDANMVSGCTYAGEVFGASSEEDPDIGITNAKTQALEQAVSLRASHVVWNSLIAGKRPTVSGKAYRCPPTPSASRPQ